MIRQHIRGVGASQSTFGLVHLGYEVGVETSKLVGSHVKHCRYRRLTKPKPLGWETSVVQSTIWLFLYRRRVRLTTKLKWKKVRLGKVRNNISLVDRQGLLYKGDSNSHVSPRFPQRWIVIYTCSHSSNISPCIVVWTVNLPTPMNPSTISFHMYNQSLASVWRAHAHLIVLECTVRSWLVVMWALSTSNLLCCTVLGLVILWRNQSTKRKQRFLPVLTLNFGINRHLLELTRSCIIVHSPPRRNKILGTEHPGKGLMPRRFRHHKRKGTTSKFS